MIRFLLDANISPSTANFLSSLGYDAKSLLAENLGPISDEEVVHLAKKQKRMIITHDLDFGEIYHFREKGQTGILVLKLKDKTVESTNRTLKKFLKDKAIEKQKLEKSLIILDETSFRVYKER